MSAIVCGKRSNYFDDTPSSPPVSKRIRCSSASPVRLSPPRTNTASFFSSSSQYLFNLSSSSLSHLDNLATLFPDMDKQFLEKVLEECGDDFDSAIRCLTELRSGTVENLGSVGKSDAAQEANVKIQIPGTVTTNIDNANSENPSAPQNILMDGADWVELFVREIMSATNMDDARNCASRALEFLEKSICVRPTAEAARGLQQENIILKEQLQALIQESNILKRAVSIQHECQKDFEDKSQELHNLKQMMSQYQEQLRRLEVNNYALTLHLKQAQQSNPLPGRFHPDVF